MRELRSFQWHYSSLSLNSRPNAVLLHPAFPACFRLWLTWTKGWVKLSVHQSFAFTVDAVNTCQLATSMCQFSFQKELIWSVQCDSYCWPRIWIGGLPTNVNNNHPVQRACLLLQVLVSVYYGTVLSTHFKVKKLKLISLACISHVLEMCHCKQLQNWD